MGIISSNRWIFKSIDIKTIFCKERYLINKLTFILQPQGYLGNLSKCVRYLLYMVLNSKKGTNKAWGIFLDLWLGNYNFFFYYNNKLHGIITNKMDVDFISLLWTSFAKFLKLNQKNQLILRSLTLNVKKIMESTIVWAGWRSLKPGVCLIGK